MQSLLGQAPIQETLPSSRANSARMKHMSGVGAARDIYSRQGRGVMLTPANGPSQAHVE